MRFLLFLILLPLTSHLPAQELIDVVAGCSFNGSVTTGQVYAFDNDQAARRIMAQITAVAPGYDPARHPFSLKAGGRTSTAEVIVSRSGKRTIMYSQFLLNKLNRTTGTNFAAVSILAHELGHVVHGHKFSQTDRHHNHRNELEADQYAGQVLALLGATEPDTRIALAEEGNRLPTFSHPDRETRLAAVTNGWTKVKQSAATPPPPPPPAVSRQAARPRGTDSGIRRTDVPIVASSSPARELSILDIKTDLNAVRNGVHGIQMWVSISQTGFRGKRISVNAYFKYQNDTPLRDIDRNFGTSSGKVSTSSYVSPKHSSSSFKRVELFIPDDQLHLARGQRHNLKFTLQLHAGGESSSIYTGESFTATL